MDKKELIERFNAVFSSPNNKEGDELHIDEIEEGYLFQPFSAKVGRTTYNSVGVAMKRDTSEYRILVQTAKGNKLFKGTKSNPLPEKPTIDQLKEYVGKVFRERKLL